jgi:hypothetical protein
MLTRPLQQASGQRVMAYRTRSLPVAVHFIGRLVLEALQLRNIQSRILRSYQLVGAYLDAVQRSRCLLEVVTAIKCLGQHDLGIGVTRL